MQIDEQLAKQLGTRIRQLRDAKGMSQSDLVADLIKLRNPSSSFADLRRRRHSMPGVISRLELGRANPSIGRLAEIAKVLGTTLIDLLTFEQPEDRLLSRRRSFERIRSILAQRQPKDIDDVRVVIEKIFEIRRRGERSPSERKVEARRAEEARPQNAPKKSAPKGRR